MEFAWVLMASLLCPFDLEPAAIGQELQLMLDVFHLAVDVAGEERGDDLGLWPTAAHDHGEQVVAQQDVTARYVDRGLKKEALGAINGWHLHEEVVHGALTGFRIGTTTPRSLSAANVLVAPVAVRLGTLSCTRTNPMSTKYPRKRVNLSFNRKPELYDQATRMAEAFNSNLNQYALAALELANTHPADMRRLLERED